MKGKIWGSLFAFCAVLNANEFEFETLDVSANKTSSEDKAFVTTGAVSSREISSKDTQSIDSIVRGIPGTYTQIDPSIGGVSTNIRGMTGFGRVASKVDGVTQTFYGTSSDSYGYHNGGSTNAFATMVDKNFLIGVDINRGGSSNDANALMGSANYRTIGVDDVVREGNIFGFLGKYSYGTNGIGPSYMGTIGAKAPISDDTKIGFIFGYSTSKIRQDYKTGDGYKMGDGLGKDEYGDDISSPTTPSMLTQKPRSILFKTELTSSDHSNVTQFRSYKNSLAGRKMDFKTYQNDYRYNPNNDLVDFKFMLSFNTADQKYSDGGYVATQDLSKLTSGSQLEQENRSFTFDIGNTSKFELADDLGLQSRYGISYLKTKYQNNIAYSELGNYGYGTSTFSPNGEQSFKSVYLENSLSYKDLTLEGNLNYTKWNIKGHKPECDDNTGCIPMGAIDVDRDDKYLNASATLSYKFHDLFEPYISYSVSNRAPTIQEMFFGSDQGNSVNPFLKAERAKTFEFGFNAYKDGLFTDGDMFGFKLTRYQTDIKNFIRNLRINVGSTYYFHINDPEPVKMSGYEVELKYDMGVFYVKGSYSRQETKTPVSETSSSYMGGFGYTQISELPKYYANVELGTRLFDEKLNIGGIAKITGKAKRVYPGIDERENGDKYDIGDQLARQDLPKIPTIYDLYISYEVTKNFSIKGEVQNVFDKNYIDALHANNGSNQVTYNANGDNVYIFSNAARGRTYYVNFEYRY
ncbi:TonB-dependent receptor domain-containing protein [Campylobacter mucosalis]|uniref:TonB-dependent heme/hemoglobin receptor family protein n=1 Tax=Campylobacter mucosalis CCUG 21559 TaxID=1032067 RepID=A0A6G5QIX9_9BACT|nr:TonB-dependent receptor [Campylobacter mucosalis]QCD45569.1 TonB-dependent heme/hemoglobin receptor family protein [Campylobacter mucosalis CCUG 21559]